MHVDLIAFGAHPDDVELFCGGTLLKCAKSGKKTGVVDLTQGELSTRGNVEIRAKEAQEAAKILKLSFRENTNIPDGKIENSEENQQKIINILRLRRPKLVLIPFWDDRHPDHKNASQLLSDALFYSGLVKIETDHAAYRPDRIVFYFHHEISDPSFVVDISGEFDQKIEAIESYRSQFYQPDSKEPETYISSKAFRDLIEVRAKYFGFQVGVAYGEPFRIKDPLKINNLSDIFA
jgi:bacillithiol biosynthesis deacetylase BshB1